MGKNDHQRKDNCEDIRCSESSEERHHKKHRKYHDDSSCDEHSESRCCQGGKCIVNNYIETSPTAMQSSGIIAYSDFFGLMPGDNPATVAPGTAVEFPQNGSTNGVITRVNASTFNLKNIGTYEVQFQVSVTEAGQLEIALDSGSGFVELLPTVVGRATGASQIVGLCLIDTTSMNTKLSIINPSGNASALTITPLAGGNQSVSCHLVIKQIY